MAGRAEYNECMRPMTGSKRIYYHGTWSGNVSSIKEKGLVPRTLEEGEQLVDKILADYGETRESVPRYYWYYPLLRLQETVGKVYLSGDKNYAACNCLAGFEAETQLRSYLEARASHKKMKFLKPGEVFKREMPCSICEVKIKEEDLPSDLLNDIKRRAQNATANLPEKFPTEQAALDYILSKGTFTLDKVVPEQIGECEYIGDKERYINECGLGAQA